MRYKIIIITVAMGILSTGCFNKDNQKVIGDDTVASITKQLIEKYGEQNSVRIEKGVKQMASLWEKEDGDATAFASFCLDNFIGDPTEREQIFVRLCKQFETIYGGFNKMTVSLMEPIHEVDYAPFSVDEMFGAWSPSAHIEDDFFANKIAFYVMLNYWLKLYLRC